MHPMSNEEQQELPTVGHARLHTWLGFASRLAYNQGWCNPCSGGRDSGKLFFVLFYASEQTHFSRETVRVLPIQERVRTALLFVLLRS